MYRILTAISPVGIFRLNMEGAVTYANQKWREITSAEVDDNDSAGESYLISVHPDDREIIAASWRTALQNTESCSFEVRWGTSDSFRWAMGELVPEIIGDEVKFFDYRANSRCSDSLGS
jgi:PAS domain-containing protein